MKKSWQKIIPIVVCFIALLIGLTSCNLFNKNNISNEKKLVGVRLEGSPIIIEVGDVDAIQLTAHLDYDDGTTESVLFTKDDIPEDIMAFANEPGEYPIEMLYRDFEVSFTLIVKTPTPKFFVKFINYNNEVVKEEFVEQGKSATAPSAEEMFVEGVHFTGEFDKDFSSVTQDLEVRGIYKEMYTVEFFNGKSELISSQKVICGNDAIEPSDAEKAMEGYVWQFWDNDFTNIQKDTKVYGVYLKAYTIIYSSEDETRGTVSGNVASGSAIVIGTAISLSAEPNEGYTFSGWYIDDQHVSADCEYSFTAFAKNYTLVARFAKEKVELVAGLYDANDKLIASWDTLVNVYGMDITKEYNYSSSASTSAPGYLLKNYAELSSGVKLVIDNSVENIGSYAFYYIEHGSSLTSVIIPESVTKIGDCAFSYCSSLASVTFEEDSLLAYIGEFAFSDCSVLTSIEVPANVTTIGMSAFTRCESLASVSFSQDSKLDEICSGAFSDCSALTSIVIPASVKSISINPFHGCKSIVEIKVADGNSNYIDIDGNLYFKEYYGDKELVAYAGGKQDASFTVPDDVRNIGVFAFSKCTNLKSVTFTQNSKLNRIENHAFMGCASLTNVDIPSTVTHIGQHAFVECSSLATIVIPDNLSVLGYGCFYGCSALTEIKVANGNINYKAINGNLYNSSGTTLIQYAPGKIDTNFTIPNDVVVIGLYSFWGCSSLISVEIPLSVTTIGNSAFTDCTSLTDVYYSGTEEDWAKISIYNGNDLLINATIHFNYGKTEYSEGLEFISNGDGTCWVSGIGVCTDVDIKIPPVSPTGDRVRGIYMSAFRECTSITSIALPEGATRISYNAFAGCTSLSNITIPEGVTSIADYAFYGCTSLSSITIPESVISIGARAFYNCDSLISVNIPNNVTCISNHMFESCDKLANVTIGTSVTSIGERAFYGCDSLMSIVIPDSVESIGSLAFYNCYKLTSIVIGEGVVSIESRAFLLCTSLKSIEVAENNNSYKSIDGNLYTEDGIILVQYAAAKNENSFITPDGVKIIGELAFNNCDSLTSVVLVDITTIGEEAFSYCSNLTNITISNSITDIENKAFYYCYNLNSITFEGTVEEWNAISFGEDWNYRSVCTIYCKDGIVTYT